MAGIPKRAKAVEAALRGAPACRNAALAWSARCRRRGFHALTDLRASAAYRLRVAAIWSSRRWPRLPVRKADTTRIAGRRMIADAAE